MPALPLLPDSMTRAPDGTFWVALVHLSDPRLNWALNQPCALALLENPWLATYKLGLCQCQGPGRLCCTAQVSL